MIILHILQGQRSADHKKVQAVTDRKTGLKGTGPLTAMDFQGLLDL